MLIDHPILSDEDRTPSPAIAETAQHGLALRQQHGRGGTEIGVRRAEQLMARAPLSDRDIKSMYSYFARHALDRRGRHWADPVKPSAGYIAWRLWGGADARDWITRLRARLREVGI